MRSVHLILGLMLAVAVAGPWWLSTQRRGRWAFEPHIGVVDQSDLFAAARLRDRLERVVVLVEEVVGTPIDTSVIRLVLADAQESATRELRSSHPELVDVYSDRHAAVPQVIVRDTLASVFSVVLGRYLPDSKTIELYPSTFEELDPGDPQGLLDVVLAHELVHVWQDQHGGVFEGEGVSSTAEADLARGAVLEGSAEFISRVVARKLGADAMFDLVAANRADSALESRGTATQRAAARWHRWAYGEGLVFVERVHDRLGGAETWRRLFSDVPTTVWSIERPDAWVDGREAGVPDLGPWAAHMLDYLQQVEPAYAFRSKWGHHPLLRKDVEDRLEHAGLSKSHAIWAACRGGVLAAGTAERGPLAGAALLLRAFRFESAHAARAARSTLEDAFDRRGPEAWSGVEIEGVEGAPRVRRGAGGSTVRTSLLLDLGGGPAYGGAWGVAVYDGLLIEVQCVRDGVEPVLLDVLAESVAAYQRERGVAVSRRAAIVPAALLALSPKTESEHDDGAERGRELIAALGHKDSAVQRFALEALAEGRILLSPWCAEALSSVVRLTTHADAWTRSLAVRAALVLREEDRLLSDARRARLATDSSLAVRRALSQQPVSKSEFGDILVKRFMRMAGMGDEEDAPVAEVPIDPAEAEQVQELWFDLLFGSPSSKEWPSLVRQTRRVLARGDLAARARILSALAVKEDKFDEFAPDFVRALGQVSLRPIAEHALSKGGLDLDLGRPQLVALLDSPRCRVAALRALAANDVAVDHDTRDRARAWMQSDERRLRCAAALLILASDPDDDEALPLLDEAWSEFSAEWRIQIRRAVAAHRPDDPAARAMHVRALYSGLFPERYSLLHALAKGEYDEGHVEDVLLGVERLGPEAATALWKHLLHYLDDLPDEDLPRAGDRLAAHLARWADQGRLPRVAAEAVDLPPWTPDLAASPACLAALDRCLLVPESSFMRCSLARLRLEIGTDEYPELPAVTRALDRLCSLRDVPRDLPPHLVDDFPDALASRPSAGAHAIRDVIRARIEGFFKPSDFVEMEDILDKRDDRIDAAVALVPELLDTDRRACVDMALEIVEAAGPRAAGLLPELRRRLGRAVPAVRRSLDAAIRRITQGDEGD